MCLSNTQEKREGKSNETTPEKENVEKVQHSGAEDERSLPAEERC